MHDSSPKSVPRLYPTEEHTDTLEADAAYESQGPFRCNMCPPTRSNYDPKLNIYYYIKGNYSGEETTPLGGKVLC